MFLTLIFIIAFIFIDNDERVILYTFFKCCFIFDVCLFENPRIYEQFVIQEYRYLFKNR